MERTKTSCRTQPATKKVVTPAQKKRIEVELHHAPDSASDVEHGDSNDVAVQAMSTPTVSLEDINFRKSTPKLSGSTSTHTPVIQRQSDSDESAIVATPTSRRKSLPPPPPPRDQWNHQFLRGGNAAKTICSQTSRRRIYRSGTNTTQCSTRRGTRITKTRKRKTHSWRRRG